MRDMEEKHGPWGMQKGPGVVKLGALFATVEGHKTVRE